MGKFLHMLQKKALTLSESHIKWMYVSAICSSFVLAFALINYFVLHDRSESIFIKLINPTIFFSFTLMLSIIIISLRHTKRRF
jgi:formate/nitrite transporter FocA (FNT family)